MSDSSEKALNDASMAEVLAKEGSVSLMEAMSSVMKELVQHSDNQFGDDGENSVISNPEDAVSPNRKPTSSNRVIYSSSGSAEENEEDEDEEDIEETPSLQEAFSAKLFNLIASLQQGNEDRLDDWENDDDAGYLTITLSEAEFFDFEEKSAVKAFIEKAKKKEAADWAAKLAEEEAAAAAASHSEMDTVADDHSNFLPNPPLPSFSSSGVEKSDIPPIVSIGTSSTYVPIHKDPFAVYDTTAISVANRRNSITERRRSEIMGQHRYQGADGVHCFFNLKVIFEPYKTGFEESKDLKHPPGTIIAGRYEVQDVLGSAAFSTALQCQDHAAEEDEAQYVCLKVIKNNKDFFDQSLDEIKLLQYINSRGDPDEHHVLRLIDFFYCKEHLFIVSELLKENLYEFGRFVRENNMEVYYTLPRLKRITKQVLEALSFIHSLRLIHCDVKPENIVIRSFSRCDVKLIDFGSSCFTTDHLTTYIQSRSYRAPEVIIGHPYDARIDIWSVGAVIAELYTGYVLFQNDSVQTMLARITGILGDFPDHVLEEGRDTGKYFTVGSIVQERDEMGQYHLVFPKRTTLESRLHFPIKDTTNPKKFLLTEDERLFVDFIRSTLCLDPRKRPTAYEALQHPWLRDADTVEFEPYIIGQPADVHLPEDGNGDGMDMATMLPPGVVPTPGASLYYPPPYDDEDDEEDDVDMDFEVDAEDDGEDEDNAMYSQSVYVGEEDEEIVDVEERAKRMMTYVQDVEEEIEALAISAQQQERANEHQVGEENNDDA